MKTVIYYLMKQSVRLRLVLIGAMSMVLMPLGAQTFETATEAVTNMGVGWNLGNTLDANSGSQQDLSSETYWGQPFTKPELFKMMKEAGFGAIRVPVTWYNHMDGNGKVNEAWMNRVKEVVDYVLAQDLYCIINVHHDTGEGNTHWLHASTEVYDQTKTKYEYLWQQIAEKFRDYDQRLLFESYNEMLDKYNSWCFATFNRTGGYNAADATDAYNAINNYARSFVNAVRGTGGNNVRRNLIINTYAAANGSGTWNEHLKEPLTKLTIPQGEKNHIAVEVHAYPSIVNGNTNKSISTIKSETKEMMSGLNTNFVSKGIPVIIGEWSTSNVDATNTDYDVRRDLMFQFVDDFVAQTKALNIATFYWMGLSDGAYRSMPSFNQPDLAERIVKAYHGSSFEGKYPTADDFRTIYSVTYDRQWGELFLYGDWNSSVPLKMSEYTGIRVELDDDYSDKLQVKVYGDKIDSSNYKEQYGPLTEGSNTSTILFDTNTVGSNVYRITLQVLELDELIEGETITAKVISATLLKKDGSETPGKISVGWGCTMTSESIPIAGITSVEFNNPFHDGRIYNLNGQQVNNPGPGIYIKDGRKYVIPRK
ncbi:MAG: glycoside hydrolase family 5 protein [Prevotella sp.]|nr:glycoside hydrolase family 5 protein [Prevotella sp.]